MKRLRFVVTAGPTREHLDPVRFLSNPSTGKMGFAVARAAARRGHDVTLVAGPVSLKTPRGVRRVDVTSARDMLVAAEEALAGRHSTIGGRHSQKRIVRNPDILRTLSLRDRRGPRSALFVGFAAETNDVLSEARRKCREKGLEMIVANDVTQRGAGFGTDTNRVTLVRKDGSAERLPLMSKAAVATRIVRECEGFADAMEAT